MSRVVGIVVAILVFSGCGQTQKPTIKSSKTSEANAEANAEAQAKRVAREYVIQKFDISPTSRAAEYWTADRVEMADDDRYIVYGSSPGNLRWKAAVSVNGHRWEVTGYKDGTVDDM